VTRRTPRFSGANSRPTSDITRDARGAGRDRSVTEEW
jgi:hypothetical protein